MPRSLALLAPLAALRCSPEPTADLEMFRRRGSDAVRLSDGDTAAEGDVVQVVYDLDRSSPGAIYSVDGRGVVTEHLPPGELRSGRNPLDHAFELDDAPSFERFYLLLGPDAVHGRDALEEGEEPDRVAARFELRKVP